MLKCEKIGKICGNRRLFDNFNYFFEAKGLYFIVGKSGCGKSTLLNILSGLDTNYEGNVCFENYCYNKLSQEEKNELRLKNFSFIFQNFNLFENDTVYNNIKVILDTCEDIKEEFKKARISEISKVFGIEKLLKQQVRNLSGGEKQRVALARSIITSPKVVFCDEPTGSLDKRNSEKVFDLLKSISRDCLVICVTHDRENAIKYGDKILEFGKEVIEEKCFELSKVKEKDYKYSNLLKLAKNNTLKLGFLMSHVKNKIKNHKFRFCFKLVFTILAFIACGLSVTLTSSLKNSIYSSFSEVVDENSLVLTKKNSTNRVMDYYSASEAEVLEITEDYTNDIDYYGETYIFDFENNFPDDNQVYTANKGFKTKLGGFNARTFNEFIYIKNLETLEIYPFLEEKLRDDEVVLSITFDQMKEVCLNLRIVRNFNELGEYLLRNDYFITLNLENSNWQYSDEQLFRVKGFIFDNKNRVYHTNEHFNKVLFEDLMRFPAVYNLNKEVSFPWYFRKIYYLHTKDFQDTFLNQIFYDEKYKEYVFDSDSTSYSPLLFSNINNSNKLFVHKVFSDFIDTSIIRKMRQLKIDYKDYYFSCESGYMNAGSNVITGFSKPAFFSMKEDLNNEVIDAYSRIDLADFMNLELPESMVDAYALKGTSNNVKFKVEKDIKNLREIKISGGFAAILNEKGDILNKEMYMSLLTKTEYIHDKMKNEFKTVKLKIIDIETDDKSVSIYHNSDYSISLFRDLFKVSSFELIPSAIVLNMNKKMSKNEIENMNTLFKDYEFKNSLLEIEESVDEATKFLKYILYVFSGVSIISVMVLSFLICIVNSLEQRREIGLFKVLGFSNSSISKMAIIENLLSILISFVLSFGILFLIGLMVEKTIRKSIGISNFSLINIETFVVLSLVSLILIILGYLVFKILVKKVNLIESVH